MKISMLAFPLVMLSYGNASAEYGCPAGMVPDAPAAAGAAASIRSCRPNNSPQHQAPIWSTRWGAIALDATGVSGQAAGERTERSAKRAAVAHCKERGGEKCEPKFTYYNQCVVVVNTDDNSLTRSASSEDEAKEVAFEACRRRRSNECKLFYSACSLPVRVQ
jgi:hypothetical protein